MSYLLDTNVISETVKQRPRPSVLAWLGKQDANALFLSAMTIGEVEYGIERLPAGLKKDSLRIWQNAVSSTLFAGRVIDVTPDIAMEWGRMKARGMQTHSPYDSLLAATARVHDLTVVTRNERDFGAHNVRIVNPWL